MPKKLFEFDSGEVNAEAAKLEEVGDATPNTMTNYSLFRFLRKIGKGGIPLA